MFEVQDLVRPGLGPLSFALGEGECLAVSGPSGGGKTLLLRALADLDPNRGAVTLEGTDRAHVAAPAWRRQVTYVATEPGWWAETVARHFADWTESYELARRLGLPAACGDWPIERLSTGERQRLGLVRALVRGPRVLLLDEPTSGLDGAATEAVEALVVEFLGRGGAAVWVTHDANQAKRVASRKLHIEGGQVVP